METDKVARLYVSTAWKRRGPLARATRTAYLDSARFLPAVWPASVDDLEAPLLRIRRLSIETQRTHIRRWKTLGRFAARELSLPDPFTSLLAPRPERRLRRTFTTAEFAALDAACQDRVDRALLALLFGTGIRIGEVPRFARQFTPHGLEVRGKSGKHVVAVEADVAFQVLQTGNGWHLWISEHTGKALRPATIAVRWRRLVERAELKGAKRGPHTARHTFSTEWLRAGGDLKKLSGQLGHASLRTTEIYTHLTVDDIAEELRRVSVLRRLQRTSRPGSLRSQSAR